MDVPADERVEYLGVGDRQLVEIAKALSMDFQIIMMDEPTAALNGNETDSLFRMVEVLKRRGVAILYVSHRLNEIFQIADKVTVLRDGELVGSEPIGKLKQDDVVKMMLGRALEAEVERSESARTGDLPALTVRGLSVQGTLRNVSLDMYFGEVLGLAGLIGSGRYALTQALFGLLPSEAKELKVSGVARIIDTPKKAMKLGLHLLPEDRKTEGILPDLSVLENILITANAENSGIRGFFVDGDDEFKRYQEAKNALSIKAHSPKQLVTTLSGGNQQKAMIGRALSRDARILLLNEPTRGVDVGTKVEIHSQIRELAKQGYAVLLSSSDIPEIVTVSDRCIVMGRGQVLGELSGKNVTEERVTAISVSNNSAPEETVGAQDL